MEVGTSLIEDVLKTIQKYRRIPSKQLEKLYEGSGLPKAIAKLVEMDLIVLDSLDGGIWKLK